MSGLNINHAVVSNSYSAVKPDSLVDKLPENYAAVNSPVIAETLDNTTVSEKSDITLQQAVDTVNKAVALQKRSLSFSFDDDSGRSVIKVIDYNTDEVIRQIPSEELLKVAQDIKRLQDEMGQSVGLLIDNKI